jgi:hypothetical protein
MDVNEIRQEVTRALAYVHAALDNASDENIEPARLCIDRHLPRLRRRLRKASDSAELVMLIRELDRTAAMLDQNLRHPLTFRGDSPSASTAEIAVTTDRHWNPSI